MFPSVNAREAPAQPTDRSLDLILVAVILLTVFYYLARVDTISVGGPSAEHYAMTGRPLGFRQHNLAALLLIGILPLVYARLRCRLRATDLGLSPGNWRRGLCWLAVGVPLALAIARYSAGDEVMRAVYPLDAALQPRLVRFAPHVGSQLVYYIAWELLFRGVLLFGLERRLGFAGANVMQTALSTLAHFGRPLPETIAAIPAGLAFGGIARHTRSIWWLVLIHLTVGAAQDWFIVR